MSDETKPPENGDNVVDLSKRRDAAKSKAKEAKPKKAKGEQFAVPPAVPVADVNVSKKPVRGHRPRSLLPDDDTLEQVRQLAALQLTQNEAAAVMLCAPSTFKKFLAEFEEAREMWEMGTEVGKASVKRFQFVAAHRSVTAAIWFGKQHLGQADKVEQTVDQTTTHNIPDPNAELEAFRKRVGIGQRVALARPD